MNKAKTKSSLKLKRNSRSKSKSRSRSRSKSKSRSRSRSRSRSSSSRSSSSSGPPRLTRQYAEIQNLTKTQIGQIISNRVKNARTNPPKNWEKWNKNNSELFNTKSVPYPEYNEVFDKKNHNDFPF